MTGITIKTRFGELQADSSQVINFPRGIPGFEDSTNWVLFHELDNQGNRASNTTVYLQSLDDPEISLPLTDPSLFGFSFQLTLSDNEAAELQFDCPENILVLTTLSAASPDADNARHSAMGSVYANISAPILINAKSRIGMQKILAAPTLRNEPIPGVQASGQE